MPPILDTRVYYRQPSLRVLGNLMKYLDNSSMDWNQIRGRIEKLITEKGLTHNQLAEISKVPQPTISRFIKGDTDSMTLENLYTLAHHLGSTVGAVIGEQEFEPDPKVRTVAHMMQSLPDYKKDVVVSTAETLVRGEKKAANDQ